MKTYHFKSVVLSSLVALLLSQTPAFADSVDRLYDIPDSGPPIDTQVETWMETSSGSLPFSFSPFDTRNSEANRQTAEYAFDTVLGVCSSTNKTGCIESVKYSADGKKWYTANFKTNHQQRSVASGRFTGDPDNPWDFLLTSLWPANKSLGLFKASLPNEFSLPNAAHDLGSDYLVNVTVTSNVEDGVARIQGLQAEALAGIVSADDAFKCQGRHVENNTVTPEEVTPDESYCYETVDLPENLQLEVNIQLGNRIDELSGWFDGRLMDPSISFGTAESPGLISIKGSPMKVNYFETNPIPKGHKLFSVPDDINEMQKQGGIGTRGAYSPRTGLETFLALESFVPAASAEVDTVWKMESWSKEVGIDQCSSNSGVQGIIITNATTYSPNPPTYNSESGNLEFQVASTRFLPDGKTLNSGYYKLILQETLADCLWGEGNAASASISVVEDSGEANSSINKIETLDGWVSFTASNFHFSAPRVFVGFQEKLVEAEITPTPSKAAVIQQPVPTTLPSSSPVPTPTPTPTESAVAAPQTEDASELPTNLLIGIAIAAWIAISGVVVLMRRTK